MSSTENVNLSEWACEKVSKGAYITIDRRRRYSYDVETNGKLVINQTELLQFAGPLSIALAMMT